jgi:hypothetical protein
MMKATAQRDSTGQGASPLNDPSTWSVQRPRLEPARTRNAPLFFLKTVADFEYIDRACIITPQALTLLYNF